MRTQRARLPYILLMITLAAFPLAFLHGCASTSKATPPIDTKEFISADEISHELWDEVLRNCVVEGRVVYPNIRDSHLDDLNQYLHKIARVNRESFLNQNEAVAFWINAYNACAVKSVLDGITPGNKWGRYRFFSRKYMVCGQEVTLRDIEKRILPAQGGDSRFHFALAAASQGFPKLARQAYTGDKLDEMLTEAARGFVNDEKHNAIIREKETLCLSKIFKWYAEGFQDDCITVKNCYLAFVDLPIEEKKPLRAYEVEYLKFDWKLNGTPLK